MVEKDESFPFERDTESSVPLWVQLRKRIVFLISSGYFKPGDQLPKIRELAADIKINFNTVNKAYLSLISDGYLESVRGQGVFVRSIKSEQNQGISSEVQAVLDDCLQACKELGLGYDDTLAQMSLRVQRLKRESEAVENPAGFNVISVKPQAKTLGREAQSR